MPNGGQTPWWRYVLAAVAYCVLALIGGYILLLANAFMPYGARYMRGDLGYSVLRAATGPAGILIANAAAGMIIGENSAGFLAGTNLFAGIIFVGLAGFGSGFVGQFTIDHLIVLLAGCTAIVCSGIFMADAGW